MAVRLKALPVLALLFAAADVLAVRWRLDHRPAELALFLQTFALWLGFGAIALVPSLVFQPLTRWWGRAKDPTHRRASDFVALAIWMAGPVALHARLDAYTAIYGGMEELARPRPWLEVAAIAATMLVALRFLPGLLAGRLRLATIALVAMAAPIGLFVDFHDEPERPAGAHAAGPSATKPNLLLLVWDTTRAQSLNVYGYDRETTPNLAELAAESVVFDNARSASRYTLTSHLSMLTGAYPSHHGARLLNQTFNPRRTPSIAGALREAGYRTGGFVGTGVLRAQTGVSFAFERWDDLVDPPVCDTFAWSLVHDLQAVGAKLAPALERNGNPHWIQDYQRPASEVLERALAWIEEPDPRPWFCFVNLYDVHWPYVPAEDAATLWVEPYAGPIDGFLFRSDRYPKGYRMKPEDEAHLRHLYDGEMWQLDRDVDRFLGALEDRRGETAVVMCSDHGEAFGEGGRYEHGDVLECQVRIPMIVRAPGATPARRPEPVSNVDVAPTLLALAGLAAPASCDGVDLLRPGAAEREILVEDRDTGDPAEVRLALYRGTWKYLREGIGERAVDRLFDLATDPDGLVDVAARHPDLVGELRERMIAMRAAWNADDDPSKARGGPANADALKALGYLGN